MTSKPPISAGIDPAKLDRAGLAALIDHTILKPAATPAEIEQICREAETHGFATVCVNSCHVSLAAALLAGCSTKVCATIGFPLGASSTAAKVCEARQAIADGAAEVDMVMNIGLLKGGQTELVEKDISAVADAAHAGKAILKVILEMGLLTEEEKVIACISAKRAGADFVKTSTGFGGGGATVADVALMRHTVGTGMGVKASGGIRTREDALALIAAGATRIGASASLVIIGAPGTVPPKGNS